MIVRKHEVGDVGRRITQLSQLSLQGLDHSHVALLQVWEDYMLCRGIACGYPGTVGDYTGVPDQRSFRVRDQKARHRHVRRCGNFLFESEAFRVGDVKSAAIKHVQPDGTWRPYAAWNRRRGLPTACCLSK